MRFALLAALIFFAAPALAEEPIKFPQKIQRTDFQGVIADSGPVYVAGQPSEAALRDLAAKGVKTIINLRTQPEMDNRTQVPYDEAMLAKELGMIYVHIPLGGRETPYTPEAVEKFAAALESANGKALLHCTVGWRASHMWAAYLVKKKGFTLDEAKRYGAAINLGSGSGGPIDGFLGLTPKPN